METLGVSLPQKAKRLPVSSQNAEYTQNDGGVNDEIQFFVVDTGNLQGAHWLASISLFLNPASGELTQGAPRASKGVVSTVTIQGNCDMLSCSGCTDTLLMNLCYAAKQCSVSRCIGTVVNIEKPLCNLGTSVQSHLITWIMAAKGAWDIFHQSYGNALRIAIDPEFKGWNNAWVDEAFFSFICSAKDELGQFAALLPSIAGMVTNYMVRSDFYDNPDNGNLRKLDNRLSAKLSMILAGTSSFFYQIMLFPLYPMIAMQRMMVCDISGIMVVIEDLFSLDMKIGRRDLQNAASFATGTCLTLSYEAGVNENAGEELSYLASDTQYEFMRSTASLYSMGANNIQYIRDLQNKISNSRVFNSRYLQKIAQRVTSMGKLSAVKHLIDAALTYTMGVVSGVQDLAQNIDDMNCRVPKFNMQQVLDCACGDTMLRIPYFNALDSRFWCKGTLMLHGPFGGFVVVHNPYTFSELSRKVGSSLRSHLECISKGSNYNCILPWADMVDDIPVIYHASDSVDATSIPLLTFQKCRENYQSKTWDEAAWVQVGETNGHYSNYPPMILNCLRDMKSKGLPNLQCLQEYAATLSESRETLFEYDEDPYMNYPPDSCVVATGLASHSDAQVANQYLPCMVNRVGIPQTTECDSYAFESMDTGTCSFQPMLWSRTSTNKIPVASSHQVSTVNADQRALNMIESARNEVLCALNNVESWENDNVNSFLFSGEGDAIHQIFDCVVQGPYSKVDFYPSGPENTFPVPTWARDAGGLGHSRRMDLPCSTDDTKPPFTCGSEIRKRIIKYFVRDYIHGNENGISKTNILLQKLLNVSVSKLRGVWNDPPGNLICSQEDDESGACQNFLPGKLLQEFDRIPGEHVTEAIFDQLQDYWKFVMTNNDPFFKYASDGSDPNMFNWQELSLSQLAMDLNIFDSNEPLVNYTEPETDYPFKNGKGIWDMCTGLLGQFVFTMPMGSIRSKEDDMDQITISTIKQMTDEGIIFDPTMDTDFDNRQQFELPGLGMLERYVNRLLEHSFKKSSTFWSYALRHVPSDSLVCSQTRDIPSLGKTLKWSDAGSYLQNGNVLQEIVLHGYGAFPLGGVNASVCMCAWELDTANHCLIPAHLCEALGQSENCKFALHSAELSNIYDRIIAYWDANGMTGYECPESDMSDSWGIVPGWLKDDANRDLTWIGITSAINSNDYTTMRRTAVIENDSDAANTIDAAVNDIDNTTARRVIVTQNESSTNNANAVYTGQIRGALRSLLYYSQAGVRAGNLNTLRESAGKANVGPASRVDKLSSKHGDVSLKKCQGKILDTFDLNSVVNDIVDDLFPVSQAVKESMPTSTCLRYSTEYMRLNIIRAINSSGIRNTVSHIQQQSLVTGDWKLKCETQLELLGVCLSNRVFEMIPQVPRTPSCPFTINAGATDYYVSSGCIVYKKSANAFYDPCRNSNLCTKQGLTLAQLTDDTKIRFDVRFTGQNEVLGSWPVEFLSSNSQENLAMQDLVKDLNAERLARNVPWRLNHTFASDAVNAGKGVENTKGSLKWWEAEGFANVSTLFCDGISDYWPMDWSKPVGYHVTVPCMNASFRTFDSAFLVQYDENNFVATMRYTSTALRDRSRSSSEYSKAGFCRRGVYGMPSFVTNTARMCTRDAKGATYDATMPILPKWDEGSFDDEYCSTSPYDTPWFMGEDQVAHPNMASMGYVALSPPGFYQGVGTLQANEIFYPSAFYTDDVVYAGVNVSDWGSNCHNEDLLWCDTVQDCKSIYPTDTVLQNKLRCFRHTCILLEDGYCYEHADCESENKLCSGEGRCENIVWEVKNSIADDIEFQVFTEDCKNSMGADEHVFDTHGASVWQQIPDLLKMYGLCSHRNWFEMKYFVNRNPGNNFALDASAYWENTATHEKDSIYRTLFEQEKFRVHSHACDRDYQYFDGVKGCAPKTIGDFHIYNSDNEFDATDYSSSSKYAKMARTFYRNNEGVDANPKYSIGMTKEGFNVGNHIMGFVYPDSSTVGKITENAVSKFQYCREMKQCHVDAYGVTFNGKQVEYREVTKNQNGLSDSTGCTRVATNDDRTECGIFGWKKSAGLCVVDYALTPLQYLICKSKQDFIDQCGNFADLTSTSSICKKYFDGNPTYAGASTKTTTAQKISYLDGIATELNEMWNKLAGAFSTDVGKTETEKYIYKMQCAEYVYESLQNNISASKHCSFATSYHTRKNDVSEALEQIKIEGGYLLSTHGLREFPFAWWVKCGMIHSKTLVQASEKCIGDSWINRFSIDKAQNLDLSVDYNIFKVDAGLTKDQYDYNKLILNAKIQRQFRMVNIRRLLNDITSNNYFECSFEMLYNYTYASKNDIIKLIQYLHDLRSFYDSGSDDSRAITRFENDFIGITEEIRRNVTFDSSYIQLSRLVTDYISYVTSSTDYIKDLDFIGNGNTGVLSADEQRVAATHRFEFPRPTDEAFANYTGPGSRAWNYKQFLTKSKVGLETTLDDMHPAVDLNYVENIFKDLDSNLQCRENFIIPLTRQHCDEMHSFIETTIAELETGTIDDASDSGYKYAGMDGTKLRTENDNRRQECYEQVDQHYLCDAKNNRFKGVSPCQMAWGVNMREKFMNWAEKSKFVASIAYKKCSPLTFTRKNYDAAIEEALKNGIHYDVGARFCWRYKQVTPVVTQSPCIGSRCNSQASPFVSKVKTANSIGSVLDIWSYTVSVFQNFYDVLSQVARPSKTEKEYVSVGNGCPDIQYEDGISCQPKTGTTRYTMNKNDLGKMVIYYLHNSAGDSDEILDSFAFGASLKNIQLATLDEISPEYTLSNSVKAKKFYIVNECEYYRSTGGNIRNRVLAPQSIYLNTPVCSVKQQPLTKWDLSYKFPKTYYTEEVEWNRVVVKDTYTKAFIKGFLREMWDFKQSNTSPRILGCLRGMDGHEHTLTMNDFNIENGKYILRHKFIHGMDKGFNCKAVTVSDSLPAFEGWIFKKNVFEDNPSPSGLLYAMQQDWSSNEISPKSIMKWLYMIAILRMYGSVYDSYDNFFPANVRPLAFHLNNYYENLESYQTLDVVGLTKYNAEVNVLLNQNSYSCDANTPTILYSTCFVSDSTHVGQAEQNKFSRVYLAARDNFLSRSQIDGGFVVPSETTLYWTGLGYGH